MAKNDTKGGKGASNAIPQHKKLAMGLPVDTGAGGKSTLKKK
jgi:hypothetical protein